MHRANGLARSVGYAVAIGMATLLFVMIAEKLPVHAQSVRVWRHLSPDDWRRLSIWPTLTKANRLPLLIPTQVPHGYLMHVKVSGRAFEKDFGAGAQDYTINFIPQGGQSCLGQLRCPGITVDVANVSAGGDIPENLIPLDVTSRYFGKVRITPFQRDTVVCYGAYQFQPPNAWLSEMQYSAGGKQGLFDIQSCDPNISQADLARFVQSFTPATP